jgi:hypothetical protein
MFHRRRPTAKKINCVGGLGQARRSQSVNAPNLKNPNIASTDYRLSSTHFLGAFVGRFYIQRASGLRRRKLPVFSDLHVLFATTPHDMTRETSVSSPPLREAMQLPES